MYTMKDFIEKKIAVRTGTGEKPRKFLEMCEKEGLKWRSRRNATSFVPELYGEDTCINYYNSCEHCGLNYQQKLYFENEHVLVVDVDEFLPAEKRPRYEIKISADGDLTTAEMIVDGETVKAATAKRNPADKFNFKKGAELAFKRLFAKKVKEKDDNRPLRVGDRVVCKAPTDGKQEIVGMHGKIIALPDDWELLNPLVEFYHDIHGHNGGGKGKEGRCWECEIETLAREKSGSGKDTRTHDPEKCAYFSAGKCLGTKENDPCKREECEKWKGRKK